MAATFDPQSLSPQPQWFPDPSGRYEHRFWDGHRWTDRVAAHGQQFSDGSASAMDTAGMRWLLPVGRSGLAIAAGYAGLFALIVLPAPVALVLGVLAALDLRRHPSKHGWGRTIFAIVTGLLGTAVLAAALFLG